MKNPWPRIVLTVASTVVCGTSLAESTMDPALDVYALPQQLVKLPDGRQMNVFCLGSGSPTVMMEAGAGGSTLEWRWVQRDIAKMTRACAYDRAGMGFSDPGPLPRTAAAVAKDFVALVKAARIPLPFVMVAHSLGSYFVRLYADQYPGNVLGMVLIDPSVEYQDRRFVAANPAFAETLRKDDEAARKCLREATAGTLTASSSRFAACSYGYSRDPAFSDALFALQIKRRISVAFRTALYSETHEMKFIDSEQLVAARRSYGDMPLIVLTQAPETADAYPGSTPEQVNAMNVLWMQMHDELASLSSRGSNRQIERSGHYIQRDRPEVVRGAVDEVVQAARSRMR